MSGGAVAGGEGQAYGQSAPLPLQYKIAGNPFFCTLFFVEQLFFKQRAGSFPLPRNPAARRSLCGAGDEIHPTPQTMPTPPLLPFRLHTHPSNRCFPCPLPPLPAAHSVVLRVKYIPLPS